MKKFLLLFMIFSFFSINNINESYSHELNCFDTVKLKEVYKDLKYERRIIGYSPPTITELYLHEEGKWIIVLTQPEGISCVLISGTNYQEIEIKKGQGI